MKLNPCDFCGEKPKTCSHLPNDSKVNFDVALSKYLEAIKADYHSWGKTGKMSDQELAESIEGRMAKEFDEGLHIVETQLYYRVHAKTFVHSFIVKQDGPKFKRGDILKSAGYRVPAKNQARGNIFGAYRILWTGAEYLR